MGKGDKKSKRGKISKGSSGVRRQKKVAVIEPVEKPKMAKAKNVAPAKETVKKAPAKKPAVKKPAAKKPAAKKPAAKKPAAKKPAPKKLATKTSTVKKPPASKD